MKKKRTIESRLQSLEDRLTNLEKRLQPVHDKTEDVKVDDTNNVSKEVDNLYQEFEKDNYSDTARLIREIEHEIDSIISSIVRDL